VEGSREMNVIVSVDPWVMSGGSRETNVIVSVDPRVMSGG
jgi:hypothetical protein